MKTLLQSALPLIVCTAVAAQAETVPPGYLNQSSSAPGASSWTLGAFADMRMQICNGHLTGGPVRTISRLSFRQDSEFTWRTATARSYANVTIRFAHADIGKLTSRFDQNHIGAPTTVFNGQLSLPDLTQLPATSPAPFYQAGLGFVCQTPFIYSARQDLMVDLELRGGVMANAAPWGLALNYGYFLDGVTSLTSADGRRFSSGLDGQLHPCIHDSSGTTSGAQGPVSGLDFVTYATKTGNPALDDKISFRLSVAGLPPNAGCMQAVSLGGTLDHNDPRFPVVPGLGCQNLMVDLGRLVGIVSYRTDAGGSAGTPTAYAPFHAALVGLDVFTQAIWNDSRTAAPKLTRVGRSYAAGQPGGNALRATVAYTYDMTSPYSFGISTTGIPLYRIN